MLLKICLEINPGDTTEEFDSVIEKNTMHSKNIEFSFQHFGGKHSKIFIKVNPGAKTPFFQISELYDRLLIILWNIYVQVNHIAYIKKLISTNLNLFLLYVKQFVISKKMDGLSQGRL